MKKFIVLMHIVSGTCAGSFVSYAVWKNTQEHNKIMRTIVLSGVVVFISTTIQTKRILNQK